MPDDQAKQWRDTLLAWVAEAKKLRSEAALPPVDAAPPEIVSVLADVRTRLDRVESLLAGAVLARHQAERNVAVVQATADDSWAEAVVRQERPTGAYGERAPRERYADADLAVLDKRRMQRQHELVLNETEAAEQVLRTYHRGLDSLRQDIHAMLRSATWVSSLEHTGAQT